jgi:hypothetical protein
MKPRFTALIRGLCQSSAGVLHNARADSDHVFFERIARIYVFSQRVTVPLRFALLSLAAAR